MFGVSTTVMRVGANVWADTYAKEPEAGDVEEATRLLPILRTYRLARRRGSSHVSVELSALSLGYPFLLLYTLLFYVEWTPPCHFTGLLCLTSSSFALLWFYCWWRSRKGTHLHFCTAQSGFTIFFRARYTGAVRARDTATEGELKGGRAMDRIKEAINSAYLCRGSKEGYQLVSENMMDIGKTTLDSFCVVCM